MRQKVHAIGLAAMVVVCTGAHAAAGNFLPQTGTWIVTGEMNGAPGRGMAIDVQGRTVVMQMYAYEASGEPVFYFANGELGADNRLTTALTSYRGGRFFGSAPLSGQLRNSPGNVTFDFASGSTGTVQFPGEGAVAMHRFAFGDRDSVQGLLGTWNFLSKTSAGAWESVTYSLTALKRRGDDWVATTDDNKLQCGLQDDGLAACKYYPNATKAAEESPVEIDEKLSPIVIRPPVVLTPPVNIPVIPINLASWVYTFDYTGNSGSGTRAKGGISTVVGPASSPLWVHRVEDANGRSTGM